MYLMLVAYTLTTPLLHNFPARPLSSQQPDRGHHNGGIVCTVLPLRRKGWAVGTPRTQCHLRLEPLRPTRARVWERVTLRGKEIFVLLLVPITCETGGWVW